MFIAFIVDMNRLFTAITSILLVIVFQSGNINASIQNGTGPFLKIRAGHHSDYLRIVIEGPGPLISQSEITKRASGIQVSFPEENISIKKVNLPFGYSHTDNIVNFTLEKVGKFKYFLLKNPDRLVIDIYEKVKEKKKISKVKRSPKVKINPKSEERIKSDTHPKKKSKTAAESFATKKKEAKSTNETHEEVQAIIVKSVKVSKLQREDDYSFIPDEYRNVTDLMKSGKYFAAIKELKKYKTGDVDSIVIYNYLYGEVYRKLGMPLKSLKYFRRAYIYTSNDKLKERALFSRAEAYQKIKLLEEAKGSYILFIRDFPSSVYINKARLNLAVVLLESGTFVEAAELFGKVGEESEAMFGMAKALHKLDMIEESKLVYDDAFLLDKKYPERFPEAFYYMGENMRKIGELEEAKKYLLMVQSGPFKTNANISLALISIEKSELKQAISKLRAVSNSRNIMDRATALFHLSKAHMKDGNLDGAIKALEKLRLDHYDSALYKEGILELSRLYRKAERTRDAVSLMKELVYTKDPPVEVYSEIEQVLLEAIEKTDENRKDDVKFIDLWKELGLWVKEKTREKFLLKISVGLRHEGEEFIKLASWLVENTSRSIRVQAAVALADYYVETGDIKSSKLYMVVADESFARGDGSVRVEVKIKIAEGKSVSAFKRIRRIKKIEKNDLKMLAGIISDLKKSKSDMVTDAVKFYENIVSKSEWDSDDYIRLADILYENGRRGKALEYYRIAYKKDPENQWVAYRISKGAGRTESKELYGKLQKGNTLLSRIAKSKLMEISLMNKVQEVY